MELGREPEVQSFLFEEVPSHIHADKLIYQPGVLRKVMTDFCLIITYGSNKQDAGLELKYANLTVKLENKKVLSCPTNEYVSLNDSISLFKALENKQGELTHVGDYISYCMEDEQVSD